MSMSKILDEVFDTFTLWNVKNVKQLKCWIEDNSDWFMKVFNELWVQQDLSIKVCNLFDKLFSNQVWKTHYEELERAKQQSDKVNLWIQDKN